MYIYIYTHNTQLFPCIWSALQEPLNELVGSLEVPNCWILGSRVVCVGKVLRPLSCCVVSDWVLCCIIWNYMYCVVLYFKVFFSQLHLITRQKRRCIVRHESQRPLPASRWDSPVVDEQKDVKDESIDTQTKCVNRWWVSRNFMKHPRRKDSW